MADVANALDPERVEKADRVTRQLWLVVAGPRGVRPAEAAHVGADHAKALRERTDQVPPEPPVLRPSVLEDDGIALAGLGVVDPQAVDVGVAVLDSLDVRHGERHAASLYAARAPSSAAASWVGSKRRVRGSPSRSPSSRGGSLRETTFEIPSPPMLTP